MKDNFDLYSWNKNRYLNKENKPKMVEEKDFDLREWNKKRYLGELDINTMGGETNVDNVDVTHGGDDPKIGAEEESDANVVGESKSYLEKLAANLSQKYPNLDFYVSDHTDRIDVIGSEQDKFNFGDKFHGKKFGEYEVFAVDDDDRGEVVRIVKSSSISRGKLEESYMYKGYKDKHFDICPAAEGLRDRLLSGEFENQVRDKNLATPTEVGEWLYQHDVLFKTEKQVLRDKEGDESDIQLAKVAIGRIVNLSRDLGIPAAEISYLKAHLKKITDIVEYSSLTEKN